MTRHTVYRVTCHCLLYYIYIIYNIDILCISTVIFFFFFLPTMFPVWKPLAWMMISCSLLVKISHLESRLLQTFPCWSDADSATSFFMYCIYLNTVLNTLLSVVARKDWRERSVYFCFYVPHKLVKTVSAAVGAKQILTCNQDYTGSSASVCICACACVLRRWLIQKKAFWVFQVALHTHTLAQAGAHTHRQNAGIDRQKGGDAAARFHSCPGLGRSSHRFPFTVCLIHSPSAPSLSLLLARRLSGCLSTD